MSWEITGNAGTDPAVNFLGTTDQQPLVIKAGGLEAMRLNIPVIDGTGNTRPGPTEMGGALSSAHLGCEVIDISEQINFNDVPMFTTGRGQKPTALVISGAIVIATSFTTDENVLGQSPGPAPGSITAFSSSGAANLRVEVNNEKGGFRAYSFGTTTADFDFHLRDETGGRDILTASSITGHIGIGTAPSNEVLTVDGLIETKGVKFTDGTVQNSAKPPPSTRAVCGFFACNEACEGADKVAFRTLSGNKETQLCTVTSELGSCSIGGNGVAPGHCCVCILA